jgi:hypothetical protein
MFSRLNPLVEGFPLPSEILLELEGLFGSVYANECKKQGRRIHFYGELYDTEMVLILTLLNSKDPMGLAPVTFFISTIINDVKTLKNQTTISVISDLFGVLIENFFRNYDQNNDQDNEDFYLVDWLSSAQGKFEFFYKTTRENILLTIEANKILKN